MSRKDYELIAASVNVARGEALEHEDPDYIAGWVEGADAVARELARNLKLGNERFDTTRFLAACGVPS